VTRLIQGIEAGSDNVTLTTVARIIEGFEVEAPRLFRKPPKKREPKPKTVGSAKPTSKRR